MGKKTASPPPAPDPVKTAQAQTASNVDTARMNANLNRLDETDPMGAVRYTDMGNDRWRKDTSLSPVGQRQFNLQNEVDEGTNRLALQGVGQASSVLGTPFSLDGLAQERAPGLAGWNDVWRAAPDGGPIQRAAPGGGPIQHDAPAAGGVWDKARDAGEMWRGVPGGGDIQRSVGADDFSADRQRVEQAMLSRMEPAFDQNRARMAQQLADQGVPAGSEAYGRRMDEMGRQENDARMQAVLAGGQEQSRMLGMDLNKGQFANQAENQNFNEWMNRGAFANDAQQRQFAQNQTEAGLANQATAQRFNQDMARAGFANQAQDQEYNQGLGLAGFANQAQGQDFSQGLSRANFANAGTAQMLNAQQADKADVANARQRQLQELLLQRSQPINEIGALLGTGQVGMPGFGQTTPVNVQGTDVQGAYGQAGAANQAAYNAATQGRQAQQGSAMGLLGTGAMAAATFF